MHHRSGGRVVIVRCGATELYEQLRLRFVDGATTVIYDRRRTTRTDTGERERRQREEDDALTHRGFYVIRPIRSRSPK